MKNTRIKMDNFEYDNQINMLSGHVHIKLMFIAYFCRQLNVIRKETLSNDCDVL